MNKAELIDELTLKTGLRKKDCALAVDKLIDIISSSLAAGESVGISRFGVFEARRRAPRLGRNPRTGEAVPIAASTEPVFRPSQTLREAVK
jgi:DNA-binding protein HU-beta